MLRLPHILTMKFRPSALFLIRRESLVCVSFMTGLFVAYLSSLHPWFMWSLNNAYWLLFSTSCMAFAYCLDYPHKALFCRTDIVVPAAVCFLLTAYMILTNALNPMQAIIPVLRACVFLFLFMVRRESIFPIFTRICQIMACLLLVSGIAFALHVVGISLPLPSWDCQYNEGQYSYTNYMLFMIDDRSIWRIIPRFSSVFLEPGHIGTAAVLLLFTQIGYWKRWYNIVLAVAALISFSLQAYVIYLALLFLAQWIKGKHVVGKMMLALVLTAAVVTGSFFYRDGENMLNNLIVLRLEMNEEGDLEGDNRAQDWFENEYESFLRSPDVWLGRNPKEGELYGNSGYRVFVYDNGIVGCVLIAALYLFATAKAESRRVWFSAMLVAAACFYVRTHSLEPYVFFPIFAVANMPAELFVGSGGKET